MARYIDADKLKERLKIISVVADDLYGMGINRGLDRAETEIDMLPAAKVEEVRHGEWKKVSEKSPRYVCTNCRHLFNNKGYKRCPECGAKMDGGKNENLL